MKIHFMGRTLFCDSCTETDGKLTLYQGGVPYMEIANIPDLGAVEAEDGAIEHTLTPLEAALEMAANLQEELAESADRLSEWQEAYTELLADDEAKRARLERIQALLDSLGDAWTLTGLIQFVRNLREILNGEEDNG